MPSSSGQLVYSSDIYHGLPKFSDNLKGLHAMVVGANGLSGAYMVKALAEAPERWSKIYCPSRRPPDMNLPKQAEFVQSDLLHDPENLGQSLKTKSVRADYIFFYAYVQPPPRDGADEMFNQNKALLENLLIALDVANIVPERFMLQTGTKTYGVHLGPTQNPQEESDPRVQLEPIFYYPQEDALFAWCKKRSTTWNVAVPAYILGAVPSGQMSLAIPLAIYAAVSAHLKEPFEYPGDSDTWQATLRTSSAMMDAYFEEWLVLNDAVPNEKFNVSDGGIFSWEKLWPRIAGWYGVESKRPPVESVDYKEMATPYEPPPRGDDKARKRGWHGFVDANETILKTFEELAELKIIPPVPKVHVQFN